MNRPSRPSIALLGAACTLALAASRAGAAEYVWANLTGTGDSLAWADAANWANADGSDAAAAPKAGDVAVLRGCVAGRIALPWGQTTADVRVESGYTRFNNSSVSIPSFSCAPLASFSYQYQDDSNPNPWFRFTGLAEADNVDGFYPNATGMQNHQHKVFCRLSGDDGRLVWAGAAPGWAVTPTNRADLLHNAAEWPWWFTVGEDAAYGAVSWYLGAGTLAFSADATLEVRSGLFLAGGNAWRWMSVGDPGADGANPPGAVRVPDGHALWFWGDFHWILRSRVDAAALVVTRRQTVLLAGDHSADTCEWRVSCGTLQLGGAAGLNTSNCRSDWWVAHPDGIPARGGPGDYVVEWAGTLAVGAENAIPKTASIFLPGAWDRPTRTTLHGTVRLDADARCAYLVVDGRPLPSGTYGTTGSGAQHVRDDLFAGTGVLVVGGAGTLLVVR